MKEMRRFLASGPNELLSDIDTCVGSKLKIWCQLPFNISAFNKSIKTHDAQASLYSDRCLRSDGLPSTPVLCNADSDDIDWPVHSLMLSLHDLRGLPLRCNAFRTRSPVV